MEVSETVARFPTYIVPPFKIRVLVRTLHNRHLNLLQVGDNRSTSLSVTHSALHPPNINGRYYSILTNNPNLKGGACQIYAIKSHPHHQTLPGKFQKGCFQGLVGRGAYPCTILTKTLRSTTFLHNSARRNPHVFFRI